MEGVRMASTQRSPAGAAPSPPPLSLSLALSLDSMLRIQELKKMPPRLFLVRLLIDGHALVTEERPVWCTATMCSIGIQSFVVSSAWCQYAQPPAPWASAAPPHPPLPAEGWASALPKAGQSAACTTLVKPMSDPVPRRRAQLVDIADADAPEAPRYPSPPPPPAPKAAF
ncbi:hypothetical protein U9M48_011495 [Paspalum notatum var. saurae]|uniref:Uncharacterized protein n=1 Tax=Paspalum notatum var. saurae TaxID=547442 RepID=A0AAQ3SVW8_PASNO